MLVLTAGAMLASVGSGMSSTAYSMAASSAVLPDVSQPNIVINPGGSCDFQNADWPHASRHNPGNVKAGWGVACSTQQSSITLTVSIWEKFSNTIESFYLDVASSSKTYSNISSIRQQIVLYACGGQGTQTYYAQAVARFTGDGNSATITTQSPFVDVTCN